MPARLLLEERHVLGEDVFAEPVVWRVPSPGRGSTHRLKYRLALVAEGQCVLRYDKLRVLAPKRWDLLAAMTGAGPMSIREAARRVGRDVKAVHGDAKALLNAGLLRKTGDGAIVFPFDAVHVDFLLSAA